MLSKDEAYKQTLTAEEKEVEILIQQKIAVRQYQVEVLNLTDHQQKILIEAGYKLTDTMNKMGKVWYINWENA